MLIQSKCTKTYKNMLKLEKLKNLCEIKTKFGENNSKNKMKWLKE